MVSEAAAGRPAVSEGWDEAVVPDDTTDSAEVEINLDLSGNFTTIPTVATEHQIGDEQRPTEQVE